jgi:hypothetical protein
LENPYQPPKPDSPVRDKEVIDFAPKKEKERPIAITLLAGLHFLGGLPMVSMYLLPAYRLIRYSGQHDYHPSAYVSVFFSLAISIAVVVAGHGLYYGTRRGWWLANIFYGYNVMQCALAMCLGLIIQASSGHAYFSQEFKIMGIRVLFFLAAIVYLNQRNVLPLFEMQNMDKWKTYFLLATASVVLAIILLALNVFQFSDSM